MEEDFIIAEKPSEVSEVVEEEKKETAPDIPMPDFKPEIDKSKDLIDQAADVVFMHGANKAVQDDKFVEKVSKAFQAGVISETEANTAKKQRFLAEEFFWKWKDVLKLVKIEEAQGLGLMKAVVVLMFVPYGIKCLLGSIFMFFAGIFDAFNSLFNSVFGETREVQRDEKGRKIGQRTGYNIFAKVLLSFVSIVVMLMLIVLVIKIFTGFDVFQWLRDVIKY